MPSRFSMRRPKTAEEATALPKAQQLASTTPNLPETLRPKTLSEVVGHADVVNAFTTYQAENTWPRAMLFSGPTGVGKSTFGYLVGKLVNGGRDVHEINAGSQGGIAKVRELLDLSRRKTLTGAPRVIILDEAHALTTDAINALLVPTERGATDTIWVFSTSEPHKLPQTLKRRFRVFNLNPVGVPDLVRLVRRAAKRLNLELGSDRAEAFAINAHGSPSLALTALERWRDAGCPKKFKSDTNDASVDPSDTQTITTFKAVDAMLSRDPKSFLMSLLRVSSESSFLFIAHVVLKGYIEAAYLPPEEKAHGLFYAFRKGATVKPSNLHCLKLLSVVLDLEVKGAPNKETLYCALLPVVTSED